jgi:hypothetical protein
VAFQFSDVDATSAITQSFGQYLVDTSHRNSLKDVLLGVL